MSAVVAGGAVGAAVAAMASKRREQRKRLGIRHCYQCEHEWVSRSADIKPKSCPRCRTKKWDDDTEVRKESNQKIRKSLMKISIVIAILSIITYLVSLTSLLDLELALGLIPIFIVGGTITGVVSVMGNMEF